jgi:hypothetical protein
MPSDESRPSNRHSMSHNALVLTGRIALTLFIAAALFGMLGSVWAAEGPGGDPLGSSAFPPGTGFDTPTLTATASATATPTRTSTPACGSNYVVATGSATVVPGTTLVPGSNCDDCVNSVTIPFPFRLYDQTFTTVNVSSNGNAQFVSSVNTWVNTCLPASTFNYAIFPHWDDLVLTGANQGIFTSISGVAPNRIFNIEWRGIYFAGTGSVDFELRLYEGSPTGQFDIIYGQVDQGGNGATVGVQKDTGSQFTQYECNTGGLTAGLMLTFTEPPCNIVGHVVWQGLPAQPNPLQQMPVTMTLKLGATEVNFPRQLTDSSGFFTVTTNLPPGTYNWRARGNTYLATAGTVVLTNAPFTQVEMGLQPNGDLNGDNLVNAPDFVQLKNNFGSGGAPPIGPDQANDKKK